MYDSVVAIAIETTGPDAYVDEIIDVAAAACTGGEIVARFSEQIRPRATLSPGVIKLTGLTPKSLKNARTADRVLADFLDFLADENALCICHDAARVRTFLRRATKDRFDAALLDTLDLARICLPMLAAHNLDALREHLGLDASGERRPAADCDTTIRLFERLLDGALDLPLPLLTEIRRLLGRRRSDPLRDFIRGVEEQVKKRKLPASAMNLDNLFVAERPPRSRRNLPGPQTYKPLDVDAVAGMFGPDGPFAESIGAYEHREGQVSMARGVAEALNGSQHLLAEAGTGIGKSLAYLVPAALWATTNNTPVVVSTNTKNLQSQLFEKDLPLIRDVLDVPFKAALIKGRRNYLCVRKLLYLLRHADLELDRKERARMAGVLAWAACTQSGDVSECVVLQQPGCAELGAKVTSAVEECPGYNCGFRERCFLYRVRRRSLAADVIVANHSVVFAEMDPLVVSPVLPPYVHLVFDEAHNIESAATSYFTTEISQWRVQYALGRLWRAGRRATGTGLVPSIFMQIGSRKFTGQADVQELALKQCEQIIDAVRRVDPLVGPFFDALVRFLDNGGGKDCKRVYHDRKPGFLWEPITAAKEALVAGLANVMRPAEALSETLQLTTPDQLPDQVDFVHQLGAAVEWLKDLVHETEFVLAAEGENYVFWVDRAPPRRGGARAWAAPVSVGHILLDQVYNRKASVIFTSATLSVCGSTGFLKKRLGVDLIDGERLLEMDAGTPFDYPNQCMVMVPTFLPEPGDRSGDYAAELGVLLAEIFRRTRGRAMALFTSYDMLRRTTGVLEEEMLGDGTQILAQGISGSRENITDVFKRDVRSVLMGTHSFWEGVDLVGETLSCLVVARLPFAVFTDPVVQARCEQIEADGGDSFLGYSVPSAVIRFRQGFGRLIRHRTDRGIVIVTDRRVVARRYGEWFRNSLPAAVEAYRDREEFLDVVEEFLCEEPGAEDG